MRESKCFKASLINIWSMRKNWKNKELNMILMIFAQKWRSYLRKRSWSKMKNRQQFKRIKLMEKDFFLSKNKVQESSALFLSHHQRKREWLKFRNAWQAWRKWRWRIRTFSVRRKTTMRMKIWQTLRTLRTRVLENSWMKATGRYKRN